MRLQIYKYILAPRPFFSIFGSFPLKSVNQNLYVLISIATSYLTNSYQHKSTVLQNKNTKNTNNKLIIAQLN